MKFDVSFAGLENALRSIGGQKAEIGSLRDTKIFANPIELKIIEQGSVVLSGEELVNQLSTVAGLLSIGETQITLHIYDPFEDEETLSLIPAPKPRYHLTECKTLKFMYESGRKNRYVSSRVENGHFKVRPYDKETRIRGDEMMASLHPCHYCLMELNHDGFAQLKSRNDRENAKINFSLSQFFEDYKSVFRCLPLYTPETFPMGNYTNDWARISRETRKLANWICACCGVNCTENTGLLHVHHMDGNRGNNKPSNLEVLCVACHKAQPLHGKMQYKPAEKLKLENLRTSQKITNKCIKCET